MSDVASSVAKGAPESRRHSLADWMVLHDLDEATIRGILNAAISKVHENDATFGIADPANGRLNFEEAWVTSAQAMRALWPDREPIIDDVFKNTETVVAEEHAKSRRALTLDKGPSSYPTIVFNLSGEPADALMIAHEFGHALQIVASRGRFVPPILRELCAFLGEGAMMTYARRRDAALYASLRAVWENDDARIFGARRRRLRAALSQPGAPYKYFWNYPIARYLAIEIMARSVPKWTWSLFLGTVTVDDVLKETGSAFALRPFHN